MDGTIASPLDLKDLCGCPLNPKDLLCFRQTSFTSNRKWHKSFGFEGLPSDLKTAPDLISHHTEGMKMLYNYNHCVPGLIIV